MTVIGAASPRDHDLVRGLGGVPVICAGLADRVREISPSVDAVLDAAGKGELQDAITLAGGPARVMTLADEHAADLGVALSVPHVRIRKSPVEIPLTRSLAGASTRNSQLPTGRPTGATWHY